MLQRRFDEIMMVLLRHDTAGLFLPRLIEYFVSYAKLSNGSI